jgi:uncharacterized membrane protein YhaH (DUF805 family)
VSLVEGDCSRVGRLEIGGQAVGVDPVEAVGEQLRAAERRDERREVLEVLLVRGVELLLPNLAVTVRRLHDSGHSGWWLLISIVPLIGAIVLLVFTLQGSDPPNKWRQGPDERAVEASALA